MTTPDHQPDPLPTPSAEAEPTARADPALPQRPRRWRRRILEALRDLVPATSRTTNRPQERTLTRQGTPVTAGLELLQERHRQIHQHLSLLQHLPDPTLTPPGETGSPSTESAVVKALALQASGAWRSLRQLRTAVPGLAHPHAAAVLAALCRSPLRENGPDAAELAGLSSLPPAVARALVLGHALFAVAQLHILNDDSESAATALRQALASSLDAVQAAGIGVPAAVHQAVADQTDGLLHTLTSQLDLALAIQSGDPPCQLALVLGMHRSGTSALTGMLVQAGLNAPRDLMPPTARNPQGYWESLGVMEVNDRFLQALGRNWATCQPLAEQDWHRHARAARQWRAELLQILHTCYPARGRAILKDPRLCVLAPGLEPWLESDLINVVFVLPIRHPVEVARSLQSAEGTTLPEGVQLWLAHVLAAERYSRGYERLIVDYEQLLEQPHSVLQGCERILKQADSTWRRPAEWTADATRFVNPELRHQRAETTSEIPPWADSAADAAWLELAQRVHSLMVQPGVGESERNDAMDALWQEWESLLP